MKEKEIITYSVGARGSNTFIVDKVLEDEILVSHPLVSECKRLLKISEVNLEAAILKDDTEKCLDFMSKHKEILDFTSKADLEALCLYFVYKRQLTPKQKNLLSNMCGLVASIHFQNGVREAMDYISKNVGVLDDFNMMWYSNFKGIFEGRQQITSKKQRASIFNIAGFVLAQLEVPCTTK